MARIVVEHVDVEFSLLGQASKRQVAAAEVANHWALRVWPKTEIKLRMERVSQEQLDDQFVRRDLSGKAPQSGFIFVGGYPDHELVAKILGQLAFKDDGSGLVDFLLSMQEAHCRPQLVLGHLLHADEQAATMPVAALPPLDQLAELSPPTQIEIADTEVGALGERSVSRRAGSKDRSMLSKMRGMVHLLGPHVSRPWRRGATRSSYLPGSGASESCQFRPGTQGVMRHADISCSFSGLRLFAQLGHRAEASGAVAGW